MPRNKGMIKKVCACRGEKFYVEPNEQWRTICKKCYKQYYLPLNKKFKVNDLEYQWNFILEKYYHIKKDGRRVLSSELPYDDPYDNGVKPYWTGLDFDYR